jgi:peptide/nickel transport system ATP-binding protein
MALLDVAHLTVGVETRAGLVTLVDDLSFSIEEGEVLGLVGESGAGKTQTGLALLGLLDPPLRRVKGDMLFEGRRLDGLSETEFRRLRGREIATVFQDSLTSLNPLMTVGQQLIETILTHLPVPAREAEDRAVQLLAETGIPEPRERMKSYSHELSGGMRQRVVLALAFSCEPKLIVADEPTTALDVSVQAQVIDLLMRMRDERGTSVLLITHDMGVIAEAADRLAVMYAGRIVEAGPTRTVLQAPRHPYSQGLIAAIPRLGPRAARLEQIEGTMPRPGERPAGCAFHPRCPHAVPRCLTEQPGFFALGETKAACWLLDGGAPICESP